MKSPGKDDAGVLQVHEEPHAARLAGLRGGLDRKRVFPFAGRGQPPARELHQEQVRCYGVN